MDSSTLVVVSAMAFAIAISGSRAQGQTSYAYEGFDYGVAPGSSAPLDGKDGGSGWNGPWIGVHQPTGLRSYWPLDSDASDAGPMGANGTLVGGATFSSDVPPGLSWSTASLDLKALPQHQYIDLDVHAGGLAGLHKGSVAMWVKTTMTSRAPLLYLADSTRNRVLSSVTLSHGKADWFISGVLNARSELTSGNAVINDGTWHHLAVTVDGAGNTVIYVDGMVDQTDVTGFFATMLACNRMAIGSGSTSSSFYTGRIDDVAIWGSVLTAIDVAKLAGLAGYAPTSPALVPGPIESLGPNLTSATLAPAGQNPAFESGGFRAFGNHLADGSGNRAVRFLSTPLDMSADRTYYLSCLLRRTDRPFGAITPCEVFLANNGQIGARFGWDANGDWVAGSESVLTVGAKAMQPSVEHFAILKIVASRLGPDQVFLRTYRENQTIPPDDTQLSGQGTGNNNWTVVSSLSQLWAGEDQLWLWPSGIGTTLEIDEIRIGATWQSVTRVGYGTGCHGTRIGVTDRPILGANDFSIDLHGAAPNVSASLLLGLAQLAVPLGVIGAPTCSLYSSAELSVALLTDGAGNATVPLAIPNLAQLSSQSLYAQWAVVAPAQSPPLAFSDGYQMLIQKAVRLTETSVLTARGPSVGPDAYRDADVGRDRW